MKQLRFEYDDGKISYINVHHISIIFFDCNSCVKFTTGMETVYNEYDKLIPNAEQKYLEFMNNNENILTLRYK